jgi:hypothetical protein
MSESRLRTGTPHGERTPQHIFTDHAWLREHEVELLRKYGECHIIVYQQQVLGTGKTRQDALEAAERNLPSDIGTVDVMIDWIGSSFRIYAVTESDSTDESG